MAGTFDNQSDVVFARKVYAQLDMFRGSSVYDEDRISLTAVRISLLRKTGVIVPLVPVCRDGIGLVELER